MIKFYTFHARRNFPTIFRQLSISDVKYNHGKTHLCRSFPTIVEIIRHVSTSNPQYFYRMDDVFLHILIDHGNSRPLSSQFSYNRRNIPPRFYKFSGIILPRGSFFSV